MSTRQVNSSPFKSADRYHPSYNALFAWYHARHSALNKAYLESRISYAQWKVRYERVQAAFYKKRDALREKGEIYVTV